MAHAIDDVWLPLPSQHSFWFRYFRILQLVICPRTFENSYCLGLTPTNLRRRRLPTCIQSDDVRHNKNWPIIIIVERSYTICHWFSGDAAKKSSVNIILAANSSTTKQSAIKWGQERVIAICVQFKIRLWWPTKADRNTKRIYFVDFLRAAFICSRCVSLRDDG